MIQKSCRWAWKFCMVKSLEEWFGQRSQPGTEFIYCLWHFRSQTCSIQTFVPVTRIWSNWPRGLPAVNSSDPKGLKGPLDGWSIDSSIDEHSPLSISAVKTERPTEQRPSSCSVVSLLRANTNFSIPFALSIFTLHVKYPSKYVFKYCPDWCC